MRTLRMQLLFTLVASLIISMPLASQILVDIETGAVWSGYNDVRIPGDGGTLFSLSEELEADPGMFYRIRVIYDFNPKHHLGVLFAPLSINSTGQLDRDIIFEGKTFSANSPLETVFKFNSYRLFYRYDFVRKEKVEFGMGFTAKIRDAKIAVKGDGMESEKTNVGFVPILNFRLLWKWSPRLALLLEGDALAAPQGRAEDVLAALRMKISDRFDLKLGYRILEGGADNDIVHNFALINYACIGAEILF